MILENPFQILFQKLENIQSTMEEMKDRLDKIEGRGINIDKPATRKEAAEYIGVSLSTIDALLRSDQLMAIRIGKSVRFDYKDLDTFIQKRKG